MHSSALQARQSLGSAQLFQLFEETKENQFATVFKNDGTALELYIRFYFGAFFKEALRMAYFELKVMIVGIGAESDFFDDCFGRLGLDLFLFFLYVFFTLLLY